jgi:hypothetical protein
MMEVRNSMSEGISTQAVSLAQRELQYMRGLMACFIYQVQVNMIENDPQGFVLDQLAELIEKAPPEVLALVDHLRSHPPQEQKDGTYSYCLPFP